MKVVIVGAGIAGLRLAQRLREAGANVQVFEKARGPSGRLATRRSGDDSFDHGAPYFTARAPAFVKQVDDWLRRGVVARWSGRFAVLERGVATLEQVAPVRYVGTPRMSALARDLAEGTSIRFSERVGSVRREGGRWTIRTEEGFEQGGFDRVLLAIPAPQAVPLLQECPTLARRADAVRMRPCHAVMVRFETDLDVEFDGAFVRSAALGWVARNASKPGRDAVPTWVLHSTAEWSDAHLDGSSDTIRAALLSAFEEALGKDLPSARSVETHRWLYARPIEAFAGTPLWHPETGIGACGDWVGGDRVEDAYVSAEALADRLEEG
jgi:predicted NAD/FAD-dependent oxidoreductase